MANDNDFEVCTFCGEMFREDKLKDYAAHYEKCRAEYKDATDESNSDWEQYYY